jgi:hypothetical protein
MARSAWFCRSHARAPIPSLDIARPERRVTRSGFCALDDAVMVRRARRIFVGCAASFWFATTSGARAEPRHFRVFEERLDRGLALTLESRMHHAERRDFTRPIFLVAVPVRTVTASELRTSAALELAVLPWLALGAELPLSLRRADVEIQPVVISEDRVLPPRWLDLSGFGLSDPLLAALFQLFSTPALGLYARAGFSVPLDDDSGAPLVPAQIPLSTGQTELFADGRAALRLPDLTLELDYRFGFRPGSAATYLVRTRGNQYANGALASCWSHAAGAGARLFPERRFSVGVSGTWSVEQSPRLVERDRSVAFLPEAVRHELGLELRLRARLSKHDALELFYEHVFLDAFEKDPFFPIVVPARGFGVAWLTGTGAP